MSSVFPRGVKDLKISAPTNVGQKACALRCKVIVISKFDFTAESACELSVKKGDVLKLLDRLANGWVLVEFIDKIAAPGLVPALYVDIAVNDPVNPVTLSWLHAAAQGQASPSFYDVQVQMLLENNTPFSINNRLYPLAVSVSNYLMYENRFWYRVDVTYSSGEHGYLCRYYSDFYDLHSSLLEHVNGGGAGVEASSAGQFKKAVLPKLPEPVPSQRRSSGEQSAIFSQRCADLSAYMHGLVTCKQLQVCPALIDWLDVSFNTLPGLLMPDTPPESPDGVNQRLLPGSVVIATKSVPYAGPLISPTEPETGDTSKFVPPSRDATRAPKSKNIYNHYQQAANAKVNIARSLSTSDNGNGRYPSRAASRLERAKTVQEVTQNGSSSPPAATPLGRSHTVKPELKSASPHLAPPVRPPFSNEPALKSGTKAGEKSSEKSDAKSGTRTPSSMQNTPVSATKPVFSPKPAPGRNVRCEIKTQANDNVVMRVALGDTPTLDQFKSAVYSKFAYNNLFIRAGESGAYEEIDSPDLDVVDTLLAGPTVYLLVT